MRFKFNMELGQLLEAYNIKIPKEDISNSLLEEIILVWDQILIKDIQKGDEVLEEKLKKYFSSQNFLRDAKIADDKLTVKSENCPLILGICYLEDKSLILKVKKISNVPS